MEIKIFEGVQDLFREAFFPECSFCEMQRDCAERVFRMYNYVKASPVLVKRFTTSLTNEKIFLKSMQSWYS